MCFVFASRKMLFDAYLPRSSLMVKIEHHSPFSRISRSQYRSSFSQPPRDGAASVLTLNISRRRVDLALFSSRNVVSVGHHFFGVERLHLFSAGSRGWGARPEPACGVCGLCRTVRRHCWLRVAGGAITFSQGLCLPLGYFTRATRPVSARTPTTERSSA